MLLAIALLGGVLALGGAAALGKLGDHTTIIREEVVPGSSAPAAFQQGKRMSINEIYRASAPGVVHIETTSRAQQSTDFFGNPFGGSQTQRALGSGFVIDKAGHVVTNYHVVRGANTIQVSFSNNERFKAKVVGVDPSTDIAVLRGQGQVARAQGPAARQLRLRAGRRPGDRDREPVRPRPLCHRRNRQRRAAPDRGAESALDLTRDPDRRRAQPRQLGRPAAERARPGDRRQRADRDRRPEPGQRRHRIRDPDQHRQGRRRRADQARQGRASVPRDRREDAAAEHRAALPPARDERRARRLGAAGQRSCEGRPQGGDEPGHRRGRELACRAAT